MKTTHVLLLILFLAAMLWACDSDNSANSDTLQQGDVAEDGAPMTVDPACSSVRLTQYWSTNWGWCEFPSDRDFLPEFAQDGITLAIAEPWNGGSYAGEPGEACGECWEISTSYASQVVMVHDLCPIEGNPLCAGSQFHFDLTPEAATAVNGGSNDAATARRVPCPVTGNVHAAILDWNQWGYLRLSFMNHRIPIRQAEARLEPGGEWQSLERSGGAWQLVDGPPHEAGLGLVFRLTSAQGQVVEGDTVLAFQQVPAGHENVQTADLGLQFDDQAAPVAGSCPFVPDGEVFGDSWGGMEGVKWTPLLWDGASIEESEGSCHEGACLVLTISQWSGLHLYLRQAFPVDAFDQLSFWVRSETPGTQLAVAPSHEGERCTERVLSLDESWQQVVIELDEVCAGFEQLTSVTLQNQSAEATIYLDEVVFSSRD